MPSLLKTICKLLQLVIYGFRGVETVGPVSPVGHGPLRSDSRAVLPDQMSERTPKYLKCYFGYISACIGPTVKYDL